MSEIHSKYLWPAAERIADIVCLSVAEIPDRDSPDDQPEMMLVTGDELKGHIIRAFEQWREEKQTESETSELRNTAWKCVDCGNSWMSALGGTCPTCGGELK
jgi:hypothetical protein